MAEQTINYEEQYHKLMDALIRSRRVHGDCKSGKRYSGKPMACSACMAERYLVDELQSYKGRTIRIG